ncbi:N-acetylglucosamine kinase [Halobacillus mangrovi]|uniref:N-acetylglucosamine kinase n=1 Tax=Halobacillus mangrovi TaxID=402384 RepID=UPI003D96842C
MQLSKSYYVGVDGGGSKTEALLCDHEGRIIQRMVAESTNLKSRSEQDVRHAIHRIFSQLTKILPIDHLKGIYVSTAGGDREEDRLRWKKWMVEVLPNFKGRIEVVNDAYGALASGTYSLHGNVLIAGTGSIAYSVTHEEPKLKRVGGWGYLFGDEGSGYDIGKEALKLLAVMHDGREKKDDEFIAEMLSDLNLISIPEIITKIYEDPYPRLKIASLSRTVIILAEQQNPAALTLVRKSIDHLLDLVKAIETRNEFLVLCGGMFHSEFFRSLFKKQMDQREIRQKLCYPDITPAGGACICALITAGITITHEIKEKAKSSYQSICDSII